MRVAVFGIAAIWVLGSLPGRAQTPAPTYDAVFTILSNQGTYAGPTTFAVDAQGTVSGTMALTFPTRVTATLGGTVKDGTWTFSYPFAMPDNNNCTGAVKGTAKVSADGKSVTGTANVSAVCIQQPEDTTFVFTRREK